MEKKRPFTLDSDNSVVSSPIAVASRKRIRTKTAQLLWISPDSSSVTQGTLKHRHPISMSKKNASGRGLTRVQEKASVTTISSVSSSSYPCQTPVSTPSNSIDRTQDMLDKDAENHAPRFHNRRVFGRLVTPTSSPIASHSSVDIEKRQQRYPPSSFNASTWLWQDRRPLRDITHWLDSQGRLDVSHYEHYYDVICFIVYISLIVSLRKSYQIMPYQNLRVG